MARLTEPDDLRYRFLFSVVLIGVAIVMCWAVGTAADRVLLPLLYTPAEPGGEPPRVINNDGTLSNGDKLRGWRNRVYFLSFGFTWLAASGAATVALIRVWPAKGGGPEPAQPPGGG